MQANDMQAIPGFNLQDTGRNKQLQVLQKAMHAADRYSPPPLGSSRLSRSGMNSLF